MAISHLLTKNGLKSKWFKLHGCFTEQPPAFIDSSIHRLPLKIEHYYRYLDQIISRTSYEQQQIISLGRMSTNEEMVHEYAHPPMHGNSSFHIVVVCRLGFELPW
ncbi:unnamed protein product [Ilex paraguariensis]|uniref:Uncharacterized protein n=1 Tax=Ilex paraguariensis TaxID=185542 RepID=A0ABC8RSX8_9AQUA